MAFHAQYRFMVIFLCALSFALPRGHAPADGIVITTDQPNPIVLYNLKSQLIEDNGLPPDAKAKDGIFSSFVPTRGQNSCLLELRSTENLPLWTQEIDCPERNHTVWVEIKMGEDRPSVFIEYQPASNPTTESFPIWKTTFVLFFLLGGIGYLLFKIVRSRTAKTIPDSMLYYKYHDQLSKEEQLYTHIQRLLPYTQVLLCPSPNRDLSEFNGLLGLFIFPQDRRIRNEFLKMELEQLKKLGPAILLIDGIHAIEEPKRNESRAHTLRSLGKIVYMDEGF